MSSLRRLGGKKWQIVIELGRDTAGKRKQRYIRFDGTLKEAKNKLYELSNDVTQGTYVDPTRLTVGEWLDLWLLDSVKDGSRPRTYSTYECVVRLHLKPALGKHRLQRLQSHHVKDYYRASSLSQSTLSQHHVILNKALKDAQRQGYVKRNVAELVMGRPQQDKDPEAIRENSWTRDEANTFLKVCEQQDPQTNSFFHCALETGLRKAELCGLRWVDLDLEGGVLSVNVQLRKMGPTPEWGPPKSKRGVRSMTISEQLIGLLLLHRKRQRELMMRNRRHFKDFGLVFSKSWPDMRTRQYHLGEPLQMNTLGERLLWPLIEKAGVKRISFHGLRHTNATLLLEAGVSARTVQQRLGHARIEQTLGTYAHVTRDMDKSATDTIASLLKR